MELLEIAERLINFDTSQPKIKDGEEMVNFVSNYCEKTGFTIEHHPYEKTDGSQRTNIIAYKGGNEARLAFSGHMDTVGVKKEEWQSFDPFCLTKNGSKFFGMGIADMKLFIAIAMKAGGLITRQELKKPLALCFTSDEEVGCLGMKKLAREMRQCPSRKIANFVLIGEPTDLTPVYLHKGYMYLQIKIQGKGGHSSNPDTSRSVLKFGVKPMLEALCEFENKLRLVIDNRFEPPFPTLNIGVINTGKGAAKNLIPKECVIEVEIRPIPGQDTTELSDILKHLASIYLAGLDDITFEIANKRSSTPPMETDVKSQIIKTVVEIMNKQPIAVSFNTEGGLFNANGSETVICGPGSINQAHKAMEYVYDKYFQDNVVEQYVSIIKRFCC